MKRLVTKCSWRKTCLNPARRPLPALDPTQPADLLSPRLGLHLQISVASAVSGDYNVILQDPGSAPDREAWGATKHM